MHFVIKLYLINDHNIFLYKIFKLIKKKKYFKLLFIINIIL